MLKKIKNTLKLGDEYPQFREEVKKLDECVNLTHKLAQELQQTIKELHGISNTTRCILQQAKGLLEKNEKV